VAAVNAAAVALYEAAGWTHAGRRRGYYRTPEGVHIDALLMSKTLPGA
jgi:ribosomal-protein-alanine N-acetyltransferase